MRKGLYFNTHIRERAKQVTQVQKKIQAKSTKTTFNIIENRPSCQKYFFHATDKMHWPKKLRLSGIWVHIYCGKQHS